MTIICPAPKNHFVSNRLQITYTILIIAEPESRCPQEDGTSYRDTLLKTNPAAIAPFPFKRLHVVLQK